MIEKYIIIYLIITFIFSYIVSFYLRTRFPSPDEIKKEIDFKKMQMLQANTIQRFLAKASLYKYNRAAIIAFLFLFNISIPILGYIFTIWITWYLANVKYEKKVVFTNILNLDEFKNTFMKVSRIFGEGSMINLINNEYTPKSKKLRALATLAITPSPASLAIIKQTLTSTDDEIRLYGYSILNNLEKKINSKINTNLHIVSDKSSSRDVIAKASTELAFSYWELVYMELSHESLKNNYLNSAISYIEVAKEYYLEKIDTIAKELNENNIFIKEKDLDSEIDRKQSDLNDWYKRASNLYTLMGRIFMYRNMHEQAKTEFTISKELLPENSTSVIPYLAEVYFNIQKYEITKSVLNQYDSLRFNAKLYPIIKQWEQKSA